MRFSDDFLNDLRAHADIEEVISRYTEVRGRGHTPVCLCPFHNEKTPSFVIYKDNQSFYCFGCGVGGDVVGFIRRIENLDYTEAVRFLCERYGVAFPSEPIDDEMTRRRRRCYEANREAARFFHACLQLPEAGNVRDYIAKRQLQPKTVTHFGLGFAPDAWDSLIKHMKSKGFSENELVLFNLARRTQRGGTVDAFRNRLMFPIIDLRGNVIAFGGRVLDDSQPKYLNSSDTVVYKKSQNLYALNFAKNGNNGRLILCEGYMDVIAFHQAGFTQAVAGLGTSFTPEQAKLLSRYAAELLVCFDSDEAGTKAAQRAQKILADTELKVRVVRMQGGKDPDEIIKKFGPERMREILEGAVNETEFALLNAKAKYDVTTEDGKIGYLNDAVAVLADVDNAIRRDVYMTKLAGELQVSKEAIAAQLKRVYKKKQYAGEKRMMEHAMHVLQGDTVASPNPQQRQYPRAVRLEEYVLAALLKNPHYLKKYAAALHEESFITEYNRRMFRIIAEKIQEDRSLMPSDFADVLSEEDISFISKLLAVSVQLAGTEDECRQFISRLAEEKEKTAHEKMQNMTDEQFLQRLYGKKKPPEGGT